MNVDLTHQFVRDYHKLLENAEKPPPPTDLLEKIKQLETEVERLSAESKKATALNEAVIKKIFTENALIQEKLKKTHAEELSRKDDELTRIQAEADRKASELTATMEAKLVAKVKSLEEHAKIKIAVANSEMDRILNDRLKSLPDHDFSEIEDRLAKLAYVPLGMRVAALVVDVLFLAVAGAMVRFGTEWGESLPEPNFILAIFAAFSLRAFCSPGNLLLGISARHIGPDHRPDGLAGFKARLVCGILHYGPIVATAYLVVLDRDTKKGLDHLVQWASDPGTAEHTLSAVVDELFRPTSPGLPGAILATSLVWWGLLLLSIVFSPLIHMGTPYFRNTTLVEWMWRVGFRRFSPPMLGSSDGDLAN